MLNIYLAFVLTDFWFYMTAFKLNNYYINKELKCWFGLLEKKGQNIYN